jgi:class 3 adenylate cyclase
MRRKAFRAGRTYDNVYFLFADASGYSRSVASHSRDHAAHAFNLLRDRLIARVRTVAAERGCARTAVWAWRGDGGFLAIRDSNESTARDVALEAGRSMLTRDLPGLRDELGQAGLEVELHIRMAIHKGPVRYASDPGLIHSDDVNFAAHLEEATPRDCLAISGDVYKVAGSYADWFEPVGRHADRGIYLMCPGGRPGDAARAWLTMAGLAGGVAVHAYPQRPSQDELAKLLHCASSQVLHLGAVLTTCASDLVTTNRPAPYRDAVLAFLQRGGTYRCILLDPASQAAHIYSTLRQGEDIPAKINEAITKFDSFKHCYGRAADGLHVYHTSEFPGLQALCTDLHTAHAMILYSPYLFAVKAATQSVERGDMPHYLVTHHAEKLFTTLSHVITHATTGEGLTRLL